MPRARRPGSATLIAVDWQLGGCAGEGNGCDLCALDGGLYHAWFDGRWDHGDPDIAQRGKGGGRDRS